MNSSSNKLGTIRRKAIALSQADLVNESLLDGASLPAVITPAVDGVKLNEWVSTHRAELLRKIRTRGGILFRGFRISGSESFEQCLKALAGSLLDYSYRSTPRTLLSGKIYTSTEYPAHQTIPQHNEMSYAREWPMILGFCCLQAPDTGGATPLTDSRNVFAGIDPEVRERFTRKKVMYVRNYGEALDLPWQDVFQTTDRSRVEEFCRQSGIDFQWHGDGTLRTTQICQAVAIHPLTGDSVWFNQAHLFHVSSLKEEIRNSLVTSAEGELPRNAYFGDGSPIEESLLNHVRSIYQRETSSFPWETGDVLIIDNMLTAHGRQPYKGARTIVVGMAQSHTSEVTS